MRTLMLNRIVIMGRLGCSGIVCVEKTVRFPVWQESAAKYCFLCGSMICCICGGNAAIRRCAHKRRRLVLTGTWVPAKDDFFLKISFSPDAQGRKGGMHHDV